MLAYQPVLPILKPVFVLALSKIISKLSNVDKVLMFNYHFCLFNICLSGTDSYIIQIFKSTLESSEFIVGNSLFHTVFTTLATFSPNYENTTITTLRYSVHRTYKLVLYVWLRLKRWHHDKGKSRTTEGGRADGWFLVPGSVAAGTRYLQVIVLKLIV
jgi:hypothetical protein